MQQSAKGSSPQLALPGLASNERASKHRKRLASAPVFKPYHQNQMMLLPPSLEELIPANHRVRLISKVVEKLDIGPVMETYKGGGTSSYHPLMLLKILLYAYVEGIYSSRLIAKAVRENVNFMWLSARQCPDFRTINNFRSGRLKAHIDSIFASLMLFLVESGYLDLEDYFVDGSKFLANASRYSYVWKKNVNRYQRSVLERIQALLSQIDQVNQEENRRYGDKDLEELGEQAQVDEQSQARLVEELNERLRQLGSDEPVSEAIEQAVEDVEKAVDQQDGGKQSVKAGQHLKQIKHKLLPRLKGYQSQLEQLGSRNSYSKTDPDATFMRLKDNALRACYNVLMGSQNGFIVNYSVHQNAADSACFIDHMEKFKSLHNRFPENVVGDAGIGNEENYRYVQLNGIGNYLKYNQFHNEEKDAKKKPYSKANFTYDAQRDVYVCPEGRELVFQEQRFQQTKTGYQREIRRYRSVSCQGCRAHAQCCRGSGERFVEFSPLLETFKQQVRQNLESEKGDLLARRRGVEIETVFAQLKFNKNYARFLLRGLEKINVELGLLSIAHNLSKMFGFQPQMALA